MNSPWASVSTTLQFMEPQPRTGADGGIKPVSQTSSYMTDNIRTGQRKTGRRGDQNKNERLGKHQLQLGKVIKAGSAVKGVNEEKFPRRTS